jgi:hypothetical protein
MNSFLKGVITGAGIMLALVMYKGIRRQGGGVYRRQGFL